MKNYNRVSDVLDGRYYYLDDKSHRLDGPAVENKDGYKAWYIEGQRHRIDGPAIEWSDGKKSWYIEGEAYAFKDWLRLVWDDLPLDKKKGYIFGGFNEEL